MELNFNTSPEKAAVTRIRTGVAAATTQSTNHYTITARYHSATVGAACGASEYQAAFSSLACRQKLLFYLHDSFQIVYYTLNVQLFVAKNKSFALCETSQRVY